MAFLRRPCKNMPGGIDESSMKSIMWRYRDDAWPAQITSSSGQLGNWTFLHANRPTVS
jgi:hypothetical protein